ncbi:thioredoxin-like protein, putative [Bodo saltans]|uniref:Thioredoxin-like protein, putative n=1 Tax=Bodo saltans TaxID=75058 RepID=A0A0S4JT38_BODSA|nr:thioredoxin-like protein, putative [Bodo saltans]|eukprot:CUG91720.1 thioredoxin-like protein, putative [Bodo saltans]
MLMMAGSAMAVRVQTKPVIPFTTRLGTIEEYNAVVHPPASLFAADRRRLVLVAYTASWCDSKCTSLLRAYKDVAAYFSRMKLFSEVVIAECVADELGAQHLAEDGVRHFPMVIIYGSHLSERDVFQGDVSDREAMIDFTKNHLLRLHEFRRDSDL